MRRRSKINRRKSRKNFRRGTGVNKRNTPRTVMRGGIRF